MEMMTSLKMRGLLAVSAIFIALMICVASTTSSFAQSLFTGELTGTVLDPSNAAVPGTSVELRNDATGARFAVTSDDVGRFRFSLLRPGDYTLSATGSGLAAKAEHVTVALGQSADVKVRLGIDAPGATVSVNTQAPLLQSNNANLATTFDQQQIENLPNAGNDLTAYAFTTPGVTMNTGGTGWGNFSVFGLPSISNVFTINGTDITDPYKNLNPSGATSLTLGANEIQEAAVVTNGYLGQYGHLAGTNMNFVTKSGTNGFHGNAWWQYNGRVLKANNWFNNATGTPRPFSISNAWADSAGGPIVKNKVFFYADNEGMRYVLPGGGPVYIPTSGFSNFIVTHLGAANPAVVPFYQSLLNLYQGASGAARAIPVTAALDRKLGCGDLADPAYGVSQPCVGTFQNTVNSLNTEWLLTTRVDYNATDNDRFYFRFHTDHGLQASSTDPINAAFNANSSQPSYLGQLGYTRIVNSRSVNTLLVSESYNSGLFGPSNLSATLRTFPTTFTFSNGLLSPLGGNDASFPQGSKTRQWQAVDDYSWIRGRHAFKAGVSFRKSFVSTYFYGALTSGRLVFNSMTDFVNGALVKGSTYQQAFATVGAEDVTFYNAGFYGQDEWRVRPNLTLTLALRLDRNSNLHCPSGCFSELTGQGSFDTVAHSAAIPYNQTIQTRLTNALGSVDAITPEPRLGIAYTLARATVLRGGVGVFANANEGLLADRFIANAPAVSIFTTSTGLVAPGVPNNIFSAVANSAAALQQGFANGATLAQLQAQVPLGFQPPNFFTISNPDRTPRYYEWNVEVQRDFGQKYLLSINYVGNHGRNEGIQEVADNGFSRTGLAGLPVSAPDPRFGQIIALNNQGWSDYHGLVSSFKWRINSQFSGQFSYTWSHSLDACSNDCVPEPFSTSGIRFQFNPLNLKSLNYSNSDYDVRHSVGMNYIYTVPTPRRQNSKLRAVIGGWTAAGTVVFHSGYPFSVVDPAVLSQFSNFSGKVTQPVLADFIANSPYPGCSAPGVPCLSSSLFASSAAQHDFGNIPRNSFRGPGYFDTDLKVNKTVSIAEKYKFQIGASFFNILNHPNFAPPVSNVSAGNFGQILSTVSAPTSAYGAVAGSAVSGRVILTTLKFLF